MSRLPHDCTLPVLDLNDPAKIWNGCSRTARVLNTLNTRRPRPTIRRTCLFQSNLMSMDDALAAVLAQAARVDAFETLDTFDADAARLWADAVSDLQVPPPGQRDDGYAVRR